MKTWVDLRRAQVKLEASWKEWLPNIPIGGGNLGNSVIYVVNRGWSVTVDQAK